MKRSWLKEKKVFLIINILILIVHIGLFFLRVFQEKKKELFNEALVIKYFKEKPPKNLKQIVESSDPKEINESPEDAKYLSDKNRRVDRQTKARIVAPFNDAQKKSVQRNFKKMKLSDLAIAQSKDHSLKEALKEIKQPSSQSNRSSTLDHLEKIPLGDMTYLNTTEYKYYGFYFRVRQKLEQFWIRSLKEKAEFLSKSGRRIALTSELLTSLRVTLNERGHIVEITIVDASGVKELDDAAIESFNQAGPFPNPPKGLLSNGRVVLDWGFLVKT
ncbi:MAG: energy transducer TonB [Bacteriovoracaceae bacterium]